MIPYDDLVAALQAWRARQGLPVSTLGGGGTAAAPQPGSQSGSGPYAQGGSGSYRQGSGPARAKAPSVPPPMIEEMAVDDAEMLEEHYDTEGADYAMNFGGGNNDDQTAVGGAPERPTDPHDFTGGGSRGRGGRGW